MQSSVIEKPVLDILVLLTITKATSKVPQLKLKLVSEMQNTYMLLC